MIVALRIYFGFGKGLLEGELEVTCTLKPCFIQFEHSSKWILKVILDARGQKKPLQKAEALHRNQKKARVAGCTF